MRVSLFSPAKINLYLAVTGRRSDGYHDLVSVAAPLDFGDHLEVEGRAPGAPFRLECSDPALSVEADNLVLRAARAFAAATGWAGGADFKLTKRIPIGAGLGGGSGNAVTALRALNRLAGGVLTESGLAAVAATLGSDCALFLAGAPVVMRGRGERVTPLGESGIARLRGRRVLLFKPAFAIGTPWAYAQMAAAAPRHYLAAEEAERRLDQWQRGAARAGELLFNNLEAVVFEKFVALPVLGEKLRREFGVNARMSGSGSACFILWDETDPPDPERVARVTARIRECWGEPAFVQAAAIG